MLPVPGKGKNTCPKMFIKYVHLLIGEVRDDNVGGDWAFVRGLFKYECK